MASLDTLQNIADVVKDIIKLDFSIVSTQSHYVPGYEDSGLSFESGKSKKSKTIFTCVLYADIRNSTTLSHIHSHEDMARLYTAFTKSILRIAEYHGAVVRNIIGDRVMLVFPELNCFKKAVDTAISINTVSKYIINPLFKKIDFEVGIGIDFGEMMIVKAGIPKKEPERTNYKNLIWIGKPANIASKLTDLASKKITSTKFHVKYNPYNFLNALAGIGIFPRPQQNHSLFDSMISTDELTDIEFAERIDFSTVLGTTYSKGKFLSFSKQEHKVEHPPILMTQKVIDELKISHPEIKMIKENFFTAKKIKIKDYTGTVYGGDVFWSDHTKIKF